MKINRNVGYESSYIFSVKISRAGENASARGNCLPRGRVTWLFVLSVDSSGYQIAGKSKPKYSFVLRQQTTNDVREQLQFTLTERQRKNSLMAS